MGVNENGSPDYFALTRPLRGYAEKICSGGDGARRRNVEHRFQWRRGGVAAFAQACWMSSTIILRTRFSPVGVWLVNGSTHDGDHFDVLVFGDGEFRLPVSSE